MILNVKKIKNKWFVKGYRTFLLFKKRKFRSVSPTPSMDDHYMNSGKPRKWRKVLYDRDPNVPDNYAPREFFLAAIERNKNLHKYSFGACVKGSCQVTLQVRLKINTENTCYS